MSRATKTKFRSIGQAIAAYTPPDGTESRPTRRIPPARLVNPRRLILEARALVDQYHQIQNAFDAPAAEQQGLLLPHVGRALLDGLWSVWRLGVAVGTPEPSDLLAFCLSEDSTYLKAAEDFRQTNPTDDERREFASIAHHRLSLAGVLMRSTVVLFPSRLYSEELFRPEWFRPEEVRPSLLHVNLLFECPLPVPPYSAKGTDDDGLIILRNFVDRTLQAMPLVRDKKISKKHDVAISGIALHADPDEITLLLEIDVHDLANGPWQRALSHQPLSVRLPQASVLRTLVGNVHRIMGHGDFVHEASPCIVATRLTDDSAMRLGRSITGPAPFHPEIQGPVL